MDQTSAIAFLDKYATGNYSPAEHREFVEWLAAAPQAELTPLVDAATMAAAARPPSATTNVLLIAKIETALDAATAEQQLRRRTLYRRITRLTAAAAALILLLGAAWYALRPHRATEANPLATTRDIPPGGNKAVLTLAGGQKIILDSARTGQLASQGSANIIK